jgi:hypothetical protein
VRLPKPSLIAKLLTEPTVVGPANGHPPLDIGRNYPAYIHSPLLRLHKESSMFNLFKSNPEKKLQKAYEEKLTEAMQAQRNGDIRRYSTLQEEAEAIYARLEALGKTK